VNVTTYKDRDLVKKNGFDERLQLQSDRGSLGDVADEDPSQRFVYVDFHNRVVPPSFLTGISILSQPGAIMLPFPLQDDIFLLPIGTLDRGVTGSAAIRRTVPKQPQAGRIMPRNPSIRL